MSPQWHTRSVSMISGFVLLTAADIGSRVASGPLKAAEGGCGDRNEP